MEIKDLLRVHMKSAKGYTPGGKPLPPIKEGINVCKLNANENQLGPSPKVVEYCKEHLNDMYLYPLETVKQARSAIAKFQNVSEDNVNIAAGSSSLICAISDLFLNPDDEIIICSPSYMAYYLMPDRYGAKMIEVPNKNYASDIQGMLDAITDKTKLVVIVNPNNPTGGKVSNEDMKYYMDNVPDHVITIVDEAYYEWVDDPKHESAIQYVKSNDKLIVLRTFSKLFGLAGLRAAYSIASKEIQSELMKLEFNYGANRLICGAIPIALNDTEYLKKSVANNTNGRKYLMEEMRKLGLEVVESYTSFIYFKPSCDPQKLLLDLNERGVIIRPFNEYLRVSIGRPEQNEQYINALKDILG